MFELICYEGSKKNAGKKGNIGLGLYINQSKTPCIHATIMSVEASAIRKQLPEVLIDGKI